MEVNLFKATATIEHDAACTARDIIDAIERIGYVAEIAPWSGAGNTRSNPPPSGPLRPRVVRPPRPDSDDDAPDAQGIR